LPETIPTSGYAHLPDKTGEPPDLLEILTGERLGDPRVGGIARQSRLPVFAHLCEERWFQNQAR
jgi:hypothetical protein